MIKGVFHSCLLCQKNFYVYPSRVKIGSGKYCSIKCHFDGRRGFSSGRVGYKHSEETRKKLSLSHLGQKAWNKGLKGYLAGEKHWNYGKKWNNSIKMLMSKNRKGKTAKDKHPMWKGGITPFNLSERIRFRNTMQKIVFERDNYTCQMCGNKNISLQIDHILSWSEHVEQRFNINNCRTLCMACHYQVTFGRTIPSNVTNWGHNFRKVVD